MTNSDIFQTSRLSVHPSIRVSHLQISLPLEVQRPSQTAAEQGKAKMHLLDLKTNFRTSVTTLVKRKVYE